MSGAGKMLIFQLHKRALIVIAALLCIRDQKLTQIYIKG